MSNQQVGQLPVGGSLGNPLGESALDDWFSYHKQLAQQHSAINNKKLGGWYTDFATTSASGSWTTAGTTGSVTPLTTKSGRLELSTTAVAGLIARIQNQSVTVQPSTDKLLIGCKLKIDTGTDAQSDCRLVTLNSVLASDYVALRLTNGVLFLELAKGGVFTTIQTSWIVDTISYHDFVISSDLSIVKAFVDNILVASTTTLTNLPIASDCEVGCNVRNGTTAAIRKVTIDKLILVTESL